MENPENNDSLIADINMTPFVDILLVLLIVFMVTAPALTSSIGVNLPKEKLSQKESRQKLSLAKSLILGLNPKKQVVFQRKTFKMELFFQKFSDLMEGRKFEKVFIQADRKVPYEGVLQLMVFLKNQGFENVGLVFDQK
ncbi:MAG: hypothetical protein COB67_08000 [SAR324 cluster bacterium]|uniref:Protein TolR n=1 Tax=SAR324 cluster bacterium TaxID=2024889 RepID=A0A2A4T286_9DELT|nr:MAG: hypothetical protein COB67_08000 [SAR324 cluster bacterium]